MECLQKLQWSPMGKESRRVGVGIRATRAQGPLVKLIDI
jgi:hypothetical protein